MLTTVSIVVVYYFVFSLMFDTPIEHELKKNTEHLREHYSRLQVRYDSLLEVLDNLNRRDSVVYKLIYEATPYTPTLHDNRTALQLRARLADMTNKELGDEFATRFSALNQKVYAGNKLLSTLSDKLNEDPEAINRIPSIQPIDNPKLTLLSTSFGRRINPFYKTMQNHDGVDYNVPTGTAVFATADGVISQIQTRGNNNGLSMQLDHGNGYKTSYSFLSRTYGSVGQRVRRGDVIAFTGNTGMSYAPHLHYEVLLNGKPVDPLGYMFLEMDVTKHETMRRIAAHAMQAFD